MVWVQDASLDLSVILLKVYKFDPNLFVFCILTCVPAQRTILVCIFGRGCLSLGACFHIDFASLGSLVYLLDFFFVLVAVIVIVVVVVIIGADGARSIVCCCLRVICSWRHKFRSDLLDLISLLAWGCSFFLTLTDLLS